MKFFKWFFIVLMGLIVAVYLFFMIALQITSTGGHAAKEAHDAVYAESAEPHKIKLIDSGVLSIKERLELIKNAKKSIELEFFIFNIDTSSRLITQALLLKAKEGVSIRLLVDFSAPVFQLRPVYAKLMQDAGIQIKYYNTSPLYNLFAVQHRSHRKLLIVDDKSVLTGGRNIADDYFDLSNQYNFLDSDILLKGPLVEKVRASFDLYWNSDFATDPKTLDASIDSEDLDKALAFLKLKDEDLIILKKINEVADQNQYPEQICSKTVFVTDFPGAGEAHRKIYSTLVKLISESQKSVLIESPYFVLRQEGYDVFKSMVDRQLKVTVLTNGLYSTDAYYVISPLLMNKTWISEIGLDLYLYRGEALATNTNKINEYTTRWGIHAKRAVIDGKTSLIGTYNIDPRSANLNSELMVVCKDNPEFAKQVSQSINDRINQSAHYMSGKKIVNAEALMQKASLMQKIMAYLAVPLATTFDFIL